MKDFPLVSIIIPVKNAAGQLPGCLESIERLDYPGDKIEVILADAHSTDDTAGIGSRFGAHIVTNEKQTVGPGRNLGFTRARGEFVVFTDADCRFAPEFLARCLKHFDHDTIAGVTGPTRIPDQCSSFEKGVQSIYALATTLCGSVHRHTIKKTVSVLDMPGCNSTYRKTALAQAMPIDERLLTGEDIDLNARLREKGFTLLAVPDAVIYHHRRARPGQFFTQMYRFAIGRLQVAKKNKKTLHPMHAIAAAGPPLTLMLLVFLLLFAPAGALYVLIGIGSAMAVFGLAVLLVAHSVTVAANSVAALLLGASGWSLGFFRELLFPLKEVRGK